MPRKSGLRGYLEATGVLEWGTSEQIKVAKQYYRKIYQREYKKRQRVRRPETIISLSKSDHSALLGAAKKHQMKLAEFIRRAALAYINQKFLTPNEEQLIELKEHLALISYDIKRLREEATIFEDVSGAEQFDLLLDRITFLEEYLREKLEHPQLLNQSPIEL